jgi:NADPH:quinone reductase-like Zn-dependent oxidoreductase
LLGHEPMGVVEEVGPAVKGLSKVRWGVIFRHPACEGSRDYPRSGHAAEEVALVDQLYAAQHPARPLFF